MLIYNFYLDENVSMEFKSVKKRELIFVIIFVISFMFTITWVYTFLRSKEEYLKGKEEQGKIEEMQKVYQDMVKSFDDREPNREERWILLEKQKDYYQTITRAVTAYDTSIHSYTPFNKYITLSMEALDLIGEFCTKNEEYQLAFNVYETIKIGPFPELVEKASKKSDEVYELLLKQKKEKIIKQKEKEAKKSSAEDS